MPEPPWLAATRGLAAGQAGRSDRAGWGKGVTGHAPAVVHRSVLGHVRGSARLGGVVNLLLDHRRGVRWNRRIGAVWRGGGGVTVASPTDAGANIAKACASGFVRTPFRSAQDDRFLLHRFRYAGGR